MKPTTLLATTAFACFAPAAIAASADVPGRYTGDVTINGDRVTPNSLYTARIRVLGAAISYGGQYDMPVTFDMKFGGDEYDPFGSRMSPVSGNVNDGNGARDFILPRDYSGGTRFSITATAWMKKRSWYSGNSNSHWRSYLTASTQNNTQQVETLRDGDEVPNIAGANGQSNIAHFVRDYIHPVTGRISLHENEVIYLMELGTTNMNSSSADFQDLVVLVSLAKDDEFFDYPDDPRWLLVVED